MGMIALVQRDLRVGGQTLNILGRLVDGKGDDSILFLEKRRIIILVMDLQRSAGRNLDV